MKAARDNRPETGTGGWKRRLWIFLRIVIGVYLGFGALLFFRQRSMIYFPQVGAPQACESFAGTGAGKLVQGSTTLYFKQNGPALVVFYHGNGGTACDRKFLADFFDAAGYSYLFVEYAGYGDSLKTNRLNLQQNARDAEAFIRTKNFSRIFIMGESLGTGLAAYHANLHDPDGLILLSPYTSLADVAAAHYPVYPARLMTRDNYRVDLGGREFPGRLLVIHGTNDDIVPLALGEKAFASARFADKEFMPVSGGGHNDLYDDPQVFRKISEFIGE